MPLPRLDQVHIDAALTNMSIAYMNAPGSHFARKVFPLVPVNKQTNKYFKFNKRAFMSRGARKRLPGTTAARTGFGISNDSYFCEEYAVGHAMPKEIAANFDSPLSADKAAVAHVSEQILIEEDALFASKFLTTSVWGTDLTGGVNFTQWSDYANSDPIGDIRTRITSLRKTIGRKPNRFVMGPEVWLKLVDHPDLLARLPSTDTQVVTEDLLAKVLGLPPGGVMVLESSYDSAQEGATESMAFTVGKVALLCYAAESPSMDEPSAGYIFHWSEFDGVAKAGAVAIRRYYEEGPKQDVYEGNSYHDMKVTASDAGVFFTSAVA